MIVVGLTGGIGSGKTTVAKLFKELDIPVYIADVEAKLLMNKSKVIKRKLIALFGENAYVDGTLNREFLAHTIFYNKSYLDKMNAIVHPKVGAHFKRWLSKQITPYVIKEVAIIFEQKQEAQYDYIITVVADKEQRIARIIKRDHSNKDKIQAIMNNQLSDEEKIDKSDYVIVNNDLNTLKAQVIATHQSLLKQIKCQEI